MKRIRRILSALLTVAMALPLAGVPAFALQSTDLIWSGENFDGCTWDQVKQKPASATFADKTDPTDKALKIEIEGMASEKYPAGTFWACYGNHKYQQITVTEYSEDTHSLTGTVNFDGTDYSVSGKIGENATTDYPGSLIIYTPEMVDMKTGAGNVATPLVVNNPQLSETDDAKVVLQASFCFEKGTHGVLASRIFTTDGKYVELFGFCGNGDTVTLQAHENATMTEGSSAVLQTETWYTVSVAIDFRSNIRTVYLDGQWQFETKSLSGNLFDLNLPFALKQNAWNVLQINRNSLSISGSVMIDDIRILNASALDSFTLAPPVTASDDFEDYATGSSLTTSNGYNVSHTGEIVAYNKILLETADGSSNRFVRVPLLYDGTAEITTAGKTNYDKTLQLSHGGISVKNGEYAVLDVDYRPHSEANTGAGTIELQLRTFSFDMRVANGAATRLTTVNEWTNVAEDVSGQSGFFLKLFDINLATGELTGNPGGFTTTGAPGLTADEWNNIRCVINLKNASLDLYVNGRLYATTEQMLITTSVSGKWTYCTNVSDLSIPENQLIIAKVNKKNTAFKQLADADSNYSNVNYIDIDNVSLESSNEVYVGAAFDVSAYEGLISTVNAASIRLSAPSGLRFATEILDLERFDELFSKVGTEVRNVEFGHLIVPQTYLVDTACTVSALKAAGKTYLTVPATYKSYYPYDADPSTTHFVGSIVDLYDANVSKAFSAVGYIKVTLFNGQEVFYYSDQIQTASVQTIAQNALTDTTKQYTATQLTVLQTYTEGNGMSERYTEDLKEMNVLALGDSLFAGTIGYDQATQWVNKMGEDNDWTLTNLGISGMTVSMTEGNTSSGKASMYDWMFNQKNDFSWGSSSTHSTPNPFFKIGDYSGKSAEDVELILLEGGCNDYGTAVSAPLGTVDSDDPATFLGAWNCIVERLLETYPNATIVFVTSWRLDPQTRKNDTLSSVEFSESVITLYEEKYADNNRVALIDAGNPNVSGVDMLNGTWRTAYSTDSYHLKPVGMEVMAKHMTPLLWEIVMNARADKTES